MPTRINWKIAGSAGQGIKSIGAIMAKAMLRHGWYVFGYDEYPSLIRGGHNTYQLLISDSPVTAPQKKVDILVALNDDSVEYHVSELAEDSLIIKDHWIKSEMPKGKVLDLPILEAAKKLGNPLVQNTILLGVTTQLMGLDDQVMKDLINDEFGRKKEMLALNIQAFEEGKKMLTESDERFKIAINGAGNDLMVLNGSEAAGMGAIAAGVQAYFAYPMTPSSPLLHFMAEHQDEFNYIVRQPEDEIAAINMALGASFAGAKAMVGTAGGGFALMQESVSLAGILELPLVIYVGMRPGPATGMPTWTSQGDLRFVIHSGHGEFPKIVLTPGDVVEAYELTHKAFELSQKYQVTVIILTDKLLAESDEVTGKFASHSTVPLMNIDWKPTQPEGEMYHRYQPSPDGVGMRTLPGVNNGFYIANSDEHTAEGLVDESEETRNMMIERRMNKLKLIETEVIKPAMIGSDEAEWCIVSFGSTKGSIVEAMKQLPEVSFCHFTQVWPMPDQAGEMIKGKKVIVVENNVTGQFEGLLKEKFGVDASAHLRKDDGRPFYPEEIVEFVKNLK